MDVNKRGITMNNFTGNDWFDDLELWEQFEHNGYKWLKVSASQAALMFNQQAEPATSGATETTLPTYN